MPTIAIYTHIVITKRKEHRMCTRGDKKVAESVKLWYLGIVYRGLIMMDIQLSN